jgi:DNA-binding IclR family transcriptional regulator
VPEIAKTADQALQVLSTVIDDGPVTAQEVASALGLNRTVTHRLLTTLQHRGFVRKHGSDYSAGPFFLRAAQRGWPAAFSGARSVLRNLAEQHGETMLLTVADGDQAVAIDQAVGQRHTVRVGYPVGERHPLTRAASGRAILAFLEPRHVERVLDQVADAAEVATVREQLELLRSQGYADSTSELHHNVYGVAVPLLDSDGYALGSLTVLVPIERAARARELVSALQRAAAELAESLLSS